MAFAVVIAFMALSFVALVPTARASMDLSGQGNLILSLTSFTITPVPGTDLTIFHFTFLGTWYGTISGPATAQSTVTESSTAGTVAGGSLNIVGTLTCDPCTVGGLTGSLAFSGTLNGVEGKTPIPGGLVIAITGGTGQLVGMSGSGALSFLAGAVSHTPNVPGPFPYTITVTLP